MSSAVPSSTDPQEPPLSIQELCTLTGLTPRTVRYYIAERLVDPPMGERRGSYYLRRHLEQLLLVRRWVDAGLSHDRIRELIAGAPEEPPARPTSPGTVEVWSRATLADGLEVHIEPGRARLSPKQARRLVQGVLALYREVRSQEPSAMAPGSAPSESPPADESP